MGKDAEKIKPLYDQKKDCVILSITDQKNSGYAFMNVLNRKKYHMAPGMRPIYRMRQSLRNSVITDFQVLH